jgi:hypothetical protein
MNYRRGLRRLYAVLAGAWLLLVLLMVAGERWLWAPWHVLPVTGDQLTREARGRNSRTGGSQFGGVPVDAPKPCGLGVGGGAVELSPSEVSVNPNEFSAFGKAKSVAALSLPLPILGYVLLFWVWPWVHRGFTRA